MNEQFGRVIGDLKSKKVYEAAYPGDISDYNQRHLFSRKLILGLNLHIYFLRVMILYQ